MTSSRRFCVVNCENSLAWSPISFNHMFQTSFEQPGDSWVYCDIASGGGLPQDLLDYQGVLLTGSHFNCRDAEKTDEKSIKSWFDLLVVFIQKAASRGKPRVYGGCFGCQIIAVALGGKVGFNPKNNFVLKAESLKLCQSSEQLLDLLHHKELEDEDDQETIERLALQATLRVIVSHGDCVLALPPDSERVATSESCENEIFVSGPHRSILACQSHPEFELQYAVYDRIWPAVVEQKKRLTSDEVELAQQSFEEYKRDGFGVQALRTVISTFLRIEGDASGNVEEDDPLPPPAPITTTTTTTTDTTNTTSPATTTTSTTDTTDTTNTTNTPPEI